MLRLAGLSHVSSAVTFAAPRSCLARPLAELRFDGIDRTRKIAKIVRACIYGA